MSNSVRSRGFALPRRWLRRVAWALGVTLGLAAAALALAVVWCRGDKTAVFQDVRGEWREARVLACEDGERSIVRRLGLVNDRGEDVCEIWYRRPRALEPGYRVLIVYAGLKTERRLLDLLPDRPDLVLAAVKYPYAKPRTVRQRLRWVSDARAACFRTVAGGMLAVSFLGEDEGLDLARLTVVGVSLGSVFATIHGALDERVGSVVVVHGGGDLPAIVRAGEQGWRAEPAAWLAWAFADTFEPLHWVERIAPRRFTLIAARQDATFPARCAQALFDRAREPRQILWTEGGHVRSRRADLVAELVGELERHLFAGDGGGR